ncbi:hypothetical protein NBRC116601_32680 [Cognatishimia sp. WU-CL00825]
MQVHWFEVTRAFWEMAALLQILLFEAAKAGVASKRAAAHVVRIFIISVPFAFGLVMSIGPRVFKNVKE